MLQAVLVLAAVIPALPDQEGDAARVARAAAYRYENLIRDRAPFYRGATGGDCDEIVGRFCLRFGSGDSEEELADSEHPDITATRRRVIRAYRTWLSAVPSDPEAAGGLIRYLIEDDRPGEAVPAARTHAALSPGPESLLFLGLALHASGALEEAEIVFDSARSLAPPAERESLDDVGALLEPDERARYRSLDPERRSAYHARFWAFSDPSRLEPGNERRAAHYARHAWIRILDDGPRARGAVSWGDDHAEIILRYGVPAGRQRVRRPPFRLEWQERAVSRYGPGSVTLVPAGLLTGGIPETPLPDARPALERDTAASSYRPIRIDRMRGLRLQTTRIAAPGSGWILRVDARLPLDTALAAAPAPGALLTVLDTVGREVARTAMVVEPSGLDLVVRGELRLPPGTYVYQAEIADTVSGLGGRALHSVVLADAERVVGDPLVARVAERSDTDRRALHPFPGAVLEVGQTVTVWASVRGLARSSGTSRYTVEWWLERRDPGTPLGRAVRWLGRTLGLATESRPVRIRWDGASESAGPVPLVVALGLEGVEPGRYRLGLRVRDRLSDAIVTSYRPLLLEPAGSPR